MDGLSRSRRLFLSTCVAADGRHARTDGDRSRCSVVGRTSVCVSGLILAWVIVRKHLGERRASADVMRGFGVRFIAEFERPLFRRHADESPIRSRLRFAPARHRLEVLVAPADGRIYPNLVDHRRNVEYDVERVLRLLKDEPFVEMVPLRGGTVGGHPFSLRNRQATRRCAVNILLLSSGGGGGNILRSLKALFRRDLIVTQKTDARYAERLRRAVTTRFLDTNEFSLTDVPKEERLVIGANDDAASRLDAQPGAGQAGAGGVDGTTSSRS